MKNLTHGLILSFLIMSALFLTGCAKEIQQVPVIVENKNPSALLSETPVPEFYGTTNLDLLNYTKLLEDRLSECNASKRNLK